MNIVDVLTKAKAVIADPVNWMQGDFTNGDRSCFCALGAIAKVTAADHGFIYFGDTSDTKAAKLLRKVVSKELTDAGHSPGVTFAPYNDSHTHAEVMEAFDKAIYLAQVEQGEVVKL